MVTTNGKVVERLKVYQDSPSPILSIYFQLFIPKKVSNTAILDKLQTFIMAHLSDQQKDEMRNNISYIVGFMEDYKQARGERTIAFFSGGDNLFEVLHLPFKIKNTVMYSHDPYLAPLLEAQENNRRYLIILNDQRKAIFYTMYAGVLEEQQVITYASVPQDVRGRWPKSPRVEQHDKVQRHVQDHMHSHLQYIAEKAVEFIGRKPINGVILGGHKSGMSQLERCLPKRLQTRVVGKFVSELQTNFNIIQLKSRKIIDKVNKSFNQEIRPAV